jgi:prepilin-type N-terminal cleavage/methylation domain-containing protein
MTISQKKNGFTLIEVIITIVIASILGMVIFTYLGNVLTKGHEPIGQVRNFGQAVEGMERVVENYQEYLNGGIWIDFTDFLDDENISYVNRRGQGSFSNDFDVLEVTISEGDQTFATIFTE